MWLVCWKHIACGFQSHAQTGNKQNLVLCEINTANTAGGETEAEWDGMIDQKGEHHNWK